MDQRKAIEKELWRREDDNGMVIEKIMIEQRIISEDDVKTFVTICHYGRCSVFELEQFVEQRFASEDPKEGE